jgi:hypothetical protein
MRNAKPCSSSLANKVASTLEASSAPVHQKSEASAAGVFAGKLCSTWFADHPAGNMHSVQSKRHLDAKSKKLTLQVQPLHLLLVMLMQPQQVHASTPAHRMWSHHQHIPCEQEQLPE